ncbi:MAG: hypothetical protein AAB771_01240 [Patescibacteria group bacterium]
MVDSSPLISKTVVAKLPYNRGRGFSFLIVVSAVIFFISAGYLAGTWFYQGVLENDLRTLTGDLDKIKKEFDLVSLEDFSKINVSIETAKTVLGGHKAVSRVFDFFEKNTLPQVRFLNFSYELGEQPSLAFSGEAKGFLVLAQQILILRKNEFLKNISLSNLSLKKGGLVGFTLTMILDPKLIKYGP